MRLSIRKEISIFFIALAVSLVLMPADGFAQSRLKKCPTSQSQRYHNCFGTFTWDGEFAGQKYVGEWRDGKFNGQGTFTWPDGKFADQKYVGEWRDGKFDGKGTFTWLNSEFAGQKYVGEFRDGKFNGQGTLYAADSSVKKCGVFKNDVLVKAGPVEKCVTKSVHEYTCKFLSSTEAGAGYYFDKLIVDYDKNSIELFKGDYSVIKFSTGNYWQNYIDELILRNTGGRTFTALAYYTGQQFIFSMNLGGESGNFLLSRSLWGHSVIGSMKAKCF